MATPKYEPGQTLEQYLSQARENYTPTYHDQMGFSYPAGASGGDSTYSGFTSRDYDPGGLLPFDASSLRQDSGVYNATNDYYAAQNKAINTTPGRGVQDYWHQGERKTGSNWNELANLIGFQGPVTTDKTGYFWEDGGTDWEGAPTPGHWSMTGLPDVSTEFRTALKDYAFIPKNDRGAPAVDIYDPSGKLIASQRTKELPQGFEKYGPAIAAMIATAVSAGTLGPALGGMLGLGEAGLTALELATLGELGINTAMLDAGVIAALGTGATSAGKTALQGGDFGDVLESGITSLAGSYAGSTVNDALPTSVSNTGIRSLDTAIDKGVRSAAGAATSSLVKGNSPEEALESALLGGAGATVSSGANSLVGNTVGQLGIPQSALNVLGPAAVAELMGGDGTSAAIKAAVNEAIGGIKGVRIPAKSGAVGANSPTSQELDQQFDDGSSLAVTRKGNVSSADTDDQRYVPGSNPFLQKNLDAAATEAEQAQLLSFANQAANPDIRQHILRDMRQEDKDYIERSLAEGGTPQQIINAYIEQKKSPEDAARMVNAIVGPKSLSTEGTVPSAKFEDAEDFTVLPDEFEPSSGDLNKVLQNAGLVQAPVEITGQTPSDYGLDFGAFAERPETSLDAAPQKVEITGQTPDTELMRFLEANGLTADEAQKVLKGTPTPKVVVQGQTPPKDAAVDDLMALLNQYDPKLDEPATPNTQEASRVEITAKKLLEDMGLDLGAYNEGPVVAPDKLTDTKTQTVPITGTKVKEELDPNFQPDEVAPDKLTDDLLQQIEIIGTKLPDLTSLENVPEEVPDTQQVLIRDKLVDDPPWEDPWMPPVEQPPVEVAPPEKPVVKPVIKPVAPKVPVVTPKVPVVTPPGTTTTPSYTMPGTTTQLHQELMQLPETDILRMLNPALYAYKDAQKRKKLSQEDQMTALLNELGYRS